jgi:uncharacterized membrane protein (DUF485 family)
LSTRPPPSASHTWKQIADGDDFRRLVRAKARFIIPATVFFIVYYFALPVLVGYFPQVMERKVIGSVNLAYLFALSQFFMAWIIMWLYVRQARRFDAMEEEIKLRHAGTPGMARRHGGIA